MERGEKLLIIGLVFIVAIVASTFLLVDYTVSGMAQLQPVTYPGQLVKTQPMCCRTGNAVYSPAAHVTAGAKCSAAEADARREAALECPLEMNGQLSMGRCTVNSKRQDDFGCYVDVCCPMG